MRNAPLTTHAKKLHASTFLHNMLHHNMLHLLCCKSATPFFSMHACAQRCPQLPQTCWQVSATSELGGVAPVEHISHMLSNFTIYTLSNHSSFFQVNALGDTRHRTTSPAHARAPATHASTRQMRSPSALARC